jgi:molybdopterin converting factor small subunit
MTVTIRFYAAARSAAGKSESLVTSGRLNDILADISRENPRLAQVFLQCSFLLDGVVLHDKTSMIPDESTVDVLPPFAGG